MGEKSNNVYSDIHSQFEEEIQYIKEELKEISLYNPNLSFNHQTEENGSVFNRLLNTMTLPHIIISIILGGAIGFGVTMMGVKLTSSVVVAIGTLLTGVHFFVSKTKMPRIHKIWAIPLLVVFFVVCIIGSVYFEKYSSVLMGNSSIIATAFMFFCFVIMSIYLFVSKGYSEKRIDKIVKSMNKLQESLEKLKDRNVQQSHAFVLSKIEELEKLIHKSAKDFQKIQSITVLDSLRLELIQNSINGINLVEDWKYLDLSEKMIDDIMTCNNNKITMLGDLSFLSTEDGLEKLVNAIDKGNKNFDIYFTGKEVAGVVESDHCMELVRLLRKKYSNNEKGFNNIKNHINLYPIFSQYFTGIGYIGLHKDDYANSDAVRFDKVYAYISSHLIEEKDIDITRANPFVFTWSSGRVSYFEKYIEEFRSVVLANNLKVKLDGQSKEKTEILSFNTQTKKRGRG